jgi:dTDP-4-dehydrorhamnose reductase
VPDERTASWLVVGADGLVGSELMRQAASAARVRGTTRRSPRPSGALALDLAAEPASWSLPTCDVAFLCAAVASLARCRQDPAASFRVNVEGTLALARRLLERGTHVVLLSSNQVFAGATPQVSESERPAPRSEYGRQKAEVERRLLERGSGVSVVRLSKVLGASLPLFDDWRQLLRAGKPVEPFDDLRLAPVPVAFVARALVEVGRRRAGGIVQISGAEDVSYLEVALHLAELCGADPELVHARPARSAGLPPDETPRHSTLDVTRLREELGLEPPPVWQTLDAVLAR